MAVTSFKLGNRRYVIMPESEYRKLSARKSRSNGSPTPRKLTRQDRGDIAESTRRLAEPERIPAESLFRKLGV